MRSALDLPRPLNRGSRRKRFCQISHPLGDVGACRSWRMLALRAFRNFSTLRLKLRLSAPPKGRLGGGMLLIKQLCILEALGGVQWTV